MIINSLHIENYKSLVDINIVNPERFCVFFGTNAAGKSNIFKAIELLQMSTFLGDKAVTFSGNIDEMFSYTASFDSVDNFQINLKTSLGEISGDGRRNEGFNSVIRNDLGIGNIFRNNFSRIFIDRKPSLQLKDGKRLSPDAFNLNAVLKRILENGTIRDEFIEWMELLIPEFSKIDFQIDEYSGETKLFVYEKHSVKPFPKHLLSDGTLNILSIFTSLYQTDEPQFLLIEEPENGLNPKVVRELVKLLREKTEELGFNIWINTHSQTFVSEISTNEAILVDKIEGKTRIKQLKDIDTFSLRVDEAWLLNMFDGGLPW